jgi:adenylosuccinate lyase
MNTTHQQYETPLVTRYASASMSELFSSYHQYVTWRKLWIALAQAQQKIGLPITNEQIAELMTHATTINFDAIARYERLFKHDVVANIHAFADLCPQARSIIHLGATSCTITDNADLIIFRSALIVVKNKLLSLMQALRAQAVHYKNLTCLGFTHGQAAQPTTVGKRIAGWLQDFLLDFYQLERVIDQLYFLGLKGATGTQASFLELLHGDHEKVQKLERLVAEAFDFKHILPIAGQTYTRKQDIFMLNVLSGIAVSAHKMATDIRLLASMKECEEPFQEHQIGSSAMPYKRNPMKCERVCALARWVMTICENPKYTASVQWFERTLDDSANRRLCIPESFLAIDGILRLLITVVNGLVVHEQRIAAHVKQELPFLALENMLVRCVQKGADRQKMHEYLREHSMATYTILNQGGQNDLFERIAHDDRIPLDHDELASLCADHVIGRAPQQVEQFIMRYVDPLLESYKGNIEYGDTPSV